MLANPFSLHKTITSPDLSRAGPFTKCNKHSCWGVVLNSPVWNKYLTIQKQIIEFCLAACDSQVPAQHSIYLIGYTEQKLRPVITIQCPDKKLRDGTIKLIEAQVEWKKFKKLHPAFGLMSSSKTPVPLGHNKHSGRLVVSRTGTSLCPGTALVFINDPAELAQQTPYRAATLGPCLFIGQKRLHVSVSHPMKPQMTITETDKDDSDTESETQVYFGDDDNLDDFEDEEAEFSSSDSEQSYDACYVANEHEQHLFNRVTTETFSPDLGDKNDGPSLDMQGVESIILGVTEQDQQTVHTTSVVGQVEYTCSDKQFAEHDWSLIREPDCVTTVTDSSSFNNFADPSDPRTKLQICALGQLPQNDLAVAVVTNNQKTIHGTLLPTTSHYKLPNSNAFLRVSTLHTSEPVRKGDCGAAVVDVATGAWHGHIIAGYEGSNIAFVLPASDIVSDISRQLNLSADDITLQPRPSLSQDSPIDLYSQQYGSSHPLLPVSHPRSQHKSIRLAELLPQLDTLVCRVRAEDLESSPLQYGSDPCKPRDDCNVRRHTGGGDKQYTALSYAWGSAVGSEARTVTIFEETLGRCLRRQIEISSNLERALRTVQNRLDHGDNQICRRLWVDALCIDHNSLRDKEQQLAMMGAIYKSATSVLTWLGDEDATSKRAMSFIKTFDRLPKGPDPYAFHAEDMKCLAALCSRQYWSRLWVVQELSLARNVQVLCGHDMVPWATFAKASSTSAECTDIVRHGSDGEPERAIDCPSAARVKWSLAMHVIKLTNSLVRKRSRDAPIEKQKTLAELVTGLSEFKCTDDHDRIYALLALARDTSADSARTEFSYYHRSTTTEVMKSLGFHQNILSQYHASSDVVVDYRMPISDLLSQLVEHEISITGSLDIICLPSSIELSDLQRTEGSAPSWLPNASRSPFTTHKGMLHRINGDPFANPSAEGSRRYRACGSKRAAANRQGFSLRVTGHQIGRINRLSDIAANGIIPREWFPPTNRQGTPEYLKLLWRTLVAEPGRRAETKSLSDCYKAFLEGIDEFPQTANIDVLKLTMSDDSTVRAFWDRVLTTIFNRRLFALESQRSNEVMLGLGQRHLQLNDVVWVLDGCSVPVVLRSTDRTGQYILVGECYIDGIMDGEVVELADDDGTVFKEITLV